jgi:hypothetical protein
LEAKNQKPGRSLNRGVTERWTYDNASHLGASVPENANWIYTRNVAATPYPWVNVDVLGRQQDGSYTTLMSEKHYFLALDAEYHFSTTGGNICADGTHNEKFENSKEVMVERQTGSGVQTETRNWAQRTAQDWSIAPDPEFRDYAIAHGQEQTANDDRVTFEDTKLENNKVRRAEYVYDDFNNVTDMKEYGFGSGVPGSLRRETIRTYLAHQNGLCYTNLNGTDGSCGAAVYASPEQAIHRRRLLESETIKDGSGTFEAAG